MKVRDRIQWINRQPWPDTVKDRVRELLKAQMDYQVLREKLDTLDMFDSEKPKLLFDGGRKLRRLAETYQALAQELAFSKIHKR